MKLIFAVVLCFASIVLAADPARPNISDVFRSQVTVAVEEGAESYKGNGIYFYDVPKGLGRITYRLDGIDQEAVIHEIFRYDLHYDFFIDQNNHCSKIKVAGDLESPWAWVAKASFAGNDHNGDNTLDIWRYYDAINTTLTLSVLSSNVNTPVHLHSLITQGKLERNTFIEFFHFETTEPDPSTFNVPTVCNATTMANVFKTMRM